jgi:predicted membrane-bound dolichyl-phosphate-mannose-protein mannosyltransferase
LGKLTTALVIKFVMTFAVAWVAITLIAGNSWTWALWAGILGTIINFIVGDKYILPMFGNITAAIADGVLGVVLLAMLDALSAALRLNGTAYITFFLLVAVGEYFFHRYLIDAGIIKEKVKS